MNWKINDRFDICAIDFVLEIEISINLIVASTKTQGYNNQNVRENNK